MFQRPLPSSSVVQSRMKNTSKLNQKKGEGQRMRVTWDSMIGQPYL
ncbi:hypothetical protein E2C01_040125 [Portunus trituberculatus]|uniref:Uncharacterized protein n=1 Tax=Portunus trituberculatus TaxID=210409 RepID=A0A5B7FLS7_PORTR|nr:hypothetical protein [Portunus trituberculatus]